MGRLGITGDFSGFESKLLQRWANSWARRSASSFVVLPVLFVGAPVQLVVEPVQLVVELVQLVVEPVQLVVELALLALCCCSRSASRNPVAFGIPAQPLPQCTPILSLP